MVATFAVCERRPGAVALPKPAGKKQSRENHGHQPLLEALLQGAIATAALAHVARRVPGRSPRPGRGTGAASVCGPRPPSKCPTNCASMQATATPRHPGHMEPRAGGSQLLANAKRGPAFGPPAPRALSDTHMMDPAARDEGQGTRGLFFSSENKAPATPAPASRGAPVAHTGPPGATARRWRLPWQ